MSTGTKDTLDFIVIGAQKSGTTSLHEYLRCHPRLVLPAGKEVPFFSHDPTFQRGWETFLEKSFFDADPSAQWGKVTAHYMAGAPYLRDPLAAPSDDVDRPELVIPRRIRSVLPDVRLIALLRDPVQRCISHHRMATLHGWERRCLRQVVDGHLDPGTLAASRRVPQETNSYVTWGEYGRILTGYYETFPAERIRVVFTDDLDERPGEVMASLFAFLGVDSRFVPPNLGQRYREGASRSRIDWLDLARLQSWAAQRRSLRLAWHALPNRRRRSLDKLFNESAYRLGLWNRLQDSPGHPELPYSTIACLTDHYHADGERLARLTGRRPPWLA